ncbi:flavodoxin family protein [Rhodoligotrophos defluvii]|uniref:flavodoxin family protein n=1 Tax=Rhodoligotrophos defluvii TaxID=2561934 RepID=UPI0010C943D4|nr:flavodoxin family protein [Rhodoligotrophos defluvii]
MAAAQICCLVASPRRDGNSHLLAQALAEGAREAGHSASTLFVDDFVAGFLRDCRSCRSADGTCSINDRYDELLLEHLLPAGAVAMAAPIYWYGLPAQLKCIIDRLVCYTSRAHPRSEDVMRGLAGKRYALLLSSEESSYGMSVGIVQQISDFSRYTHGSLVALLNAVGNRRGEIKHDPAEPLTAARRIGRDLFRLRATDYRIDTQRPGAVWGAGGDHP